MKSHWSEEQIKGKSNVFSRFSCGQLRVADVLSPLLFSLVWLSVAFFILRVCACVCVHVYVCFLVVAVNGEHEGK